MPIQSKIIIFSKFDCNHIAPANIMRIYISSTQKDLLKYRIGVAKALEGIGHTVLQMEKYTSEETRPLDRCVTDVKSAQIYVGIFAWRYGSPPKFSPVTIDLPSDNSEYYRKRGDLYYNFKDYKKVIADCNEAIRLNPSTSSYITRGLSYEALGEYKLARQDFKKFRKVGWVYNNWPKPPTARAAWNRVF